MKLYNKNIIGLAIGLLSLASCQNEELISNEGLGTLEFFTSTEIGTRTSLQDGKTVVWNEGDAVAVYDFVTTKHRFEATINGGKTSFIGNITPKHGSFIAAYPYDLAAENDVSKNIIMHLPTEQTAVADGFGPNLNLSIAKGERNVDGSPSEVQFRNLCQLFKFSVPAYAANRITKVELIANTAIAGEITIDYDDYNPVVTTNSQGSKTVELLSPVENETFPEGTYYFVLAPEQLEGFTLKLTDTNGKTYTQHSNTTLGGNSGVICNLGNIDLINVPTITPQHVYTDGILMGTSVSLTAPVPDKAWSATIKNANGETVRTLTEATGTLTTDHTDENWPYLPKGNYTVEYNYTTANGKQMEETTSFSITEEPQFSITFAANSSYSYYQAGNVGTANSTAWNKVTGIVCQAHGILPSLLVNEKYGFSLTDNFNGTISSTSDNTANYADLTINNLGETTLSVSVTFDGTTKNATSVVNITGLPFIFAPPTTSTWQKSGKVVDKGEYARLGEASSFDQSLSYSNVRIPQGTNVSLEYKFKPHAGVVSTTCTIYAENQELISGKADSYKDPTYEGSVTKTLSSLITRIQCYNSYGAGATYTDVYKIGLSYSE